MHFDISLCSPTGLAGAGEWGIGLDMQIILNVLCVLAIILSVK